MSDLPNTSDTPTPVPSTPLTPPAPKLVASRLVPPTASTTVTPAPALDLPLHASPVTAASVTMPPVETAPSINATASRPAVGKLPESTKFVSPMPQITPSDDSIPAFLPIVAGFAALASLAVAALLYLKR